MDITCEKCGSLYEVDDSRIPPGGLTLKCPRCLASFSVRRPAPAAPAGAPGASRYYLRRRTGKVFGPFLERAIASMLEQHKLDGDEMVSLDGQSWQPLSQVPSLAGLLGGSSAAQAPAERVLGDREAEELADLPAPKGGLAELARMPTAPKGGLAELGGVAPAGGLDELAGAAAAGSLDELAGMPAAGSLDELASVAAAGGPDELADLPAPKGTSYETADLPAPKRAGRTPGGVSASHRGLDLAGFDEPGGQDAGELDVGSPRAPELAGKIGLEDLADLPAPKRDSRPGTSAPGTVDAPSSTPPRRANSLEYGQLDFGSDTAEDLSDLPAPKEIDLPEPAELADLPAPKGAPELPDLPRPKPPAVPGIPAPLGARRGEVPRSGTGLEYGQIDLGDVEEAGELDELPLEVAPPCPATPATKPRAGVPQGDAPDLPAPKPRADVPQSDPPDLVAPKPHEPGPAIDVVAPKRPAALPPENEAPAVVISAPRPRERGPGVAQQEKPAPPQSASAGARETPAQARSRAAARRARRIKPLWVAAGAGTFVLVAGLCLGLLTDLGFFGVNLITGDHARRQRARARLASASAALRSDTYPGYCQAADDLASAARALGEEAEPWALGAQAAAALLHRYGPNPQRRLELESALDKLQKLEDHSSEAQKARALQSLAGGQAAAAAAALKKLSDQEPGDAMAALYLGWAMLASRDPRGALAAFARALAAQPRLAGALFGSAEAHCALKDLKGCESWADKTLAASPAHAGALLRKARLLMSSNRAPQAESLLKRVSAQQAGPPEVSLARTLLAEQALLGGQADQARRLLVEALRIDPRNALAHLSMGRLHYGARRYSEAEKLFRTARSLDPGDLQAAALLAHTQIALGRPLEANKVVQELRQSAPDSPEVLYLQGLVEEALGKLSSAGEFYKKLLGRVPDHLDAFVHLAKIHLRQDRPEDAKALLEQAGSRISVTPALRVAQGEILYLSKSLDRARLRLEEALRLEPTHNQATFLLASVLFDQGQTEAARDRLLDLMKRDRSYPGGAAKLGEVYLRLRQPAQAAGLFDQALAEESPSSSVRLAAARAYLEANQLAKALQQCAQVLEQDVTLTGAARALMSEAHFKQNKLDEAAFDIQQALDREKKAPYYFLLGRIQEARSKAAEALDAYTEALKLDSANVEVRLRRAVMLVKGGTVKDGLKELKAVIAANPTSAEAYFYMGEAQADLGEPAKALQSYRAAVARDPRHGQAHLKIALAHLDVQRRAEALPHLEAAVKAAQPGDPWLADAYYQLGLAAQASGQKKRAIEALRMYLQVAPSRAALRSVAEKRLRELGAASSP